MFMNWLIIIANNIKNYKIQLLNIIFELNKKYFYKICIMLMNWFFNNIN